MCITLSLCVLAGRLWYQLIPRAVGYLPKPVSVVFKMISRQQAGQRGAMVCGFRAPERKGYRC